MKYKNLPAEPIGWEPETACNVVQSDYEDEEEDEDNTEVEGDTEVEASDQDSERSFRCSSKKKIEKKYKKKEVVGIILQEDLFFFPEVY